MKLWYKFLNNYRQIVDIKNVDLCQFLDNANSNMFLRDPLLTMKVAFPNVEFKCPWKVNIVIFEFKF